MKKHNKKTAAKPRLQASPAKHRDVLRQEQIPEGPDYPLPLRFDSKPVYPNYLPARTRTQQTIKETKVTTSRPRATTHRPPSASRQPTVKTRVIEVSSEDSDASSGSCQCPPRYPIYKPLNQPPFPRRRRKRNYIPFYDSTVLEMNRINRINFVDTSTSESEQSDDGHQADSYQQPLHVHRVSQPPLQPNVHFDVPQPQNTNSQPTQHQEPQYSYKPPPLSQPVSTSQHTRLKKQSNVPLNKPVYTEPGREFSFDLSIVRKRYETPPVVHPQPLSKPSAPRVVIGPTKPLYRKPVERKRKVIPPQPPQPLPQVPPGGKFKPTKQNQMKNRSIVEKVEEASSSSDCACDCLSDCC